MDAEDLEALEHELLLNVHPTVTDLPRFAHSQTELMVAILKELRAMRADMVEARSA